MKRVLSLVIALAVLFSLCACSNARYPFKDSIEFYYPRIKVTYGANDSVISREVREGYGYTENLCKTLDLYFLGPESQELFSPFPHNLTAIKSELADNQLVITLSTEFSELTGLDLTVACACLTLTALKLTEATVVEIRVEDALLDGNRSIIMDESCILLLDDSPVPTEN